jgi:hypothetical protein
MKRVWMLTQESRPLPAVLAMMAKNPFLSSGCLSCERTICRGLFGREIFIVGSVKSDLRWENINPLRFDKGMKKRFAKYWDFFWFLAAGLCRVYKSMNFLCWHVVCRYICGTPSYFFVHLVKDVKRVVLLPLKNAAFEKRCHHPPLNPTSIVFSFLISHRAEFFLVPPGHCGQLLS